MSTTIYSQNDAAVGAVKDRPVNGAVISSSSSSTSATSSIGDNDTSTTSMKRKLVDYSLGNEDGEGEDSDDGGGGSGVGDGGSGGGGSDGDLPVKKRKNSSGTKAYEGDDGVKKVYVWDLDETLIIFQSLITGTLIETVREIWLKCG